MCAEMTRGGEKEAVSEADQNDGTGGCTRSCQIPCPNRQGNQELEDAVQIRLGPLIWSSLAFIHEGGRDYSLRIVVIGSCLIFCAEITPRPLD